MRTLITLRVVPGGMHMRLGRLPTLGAALIVLIAITIVYFLRPGPGTPAITLRIIGEDVPPLAALASVAKKYEDQKKVKFEIEKFEFNVAVQKATQDMASGRGYY